MDTRKLTLVKLENKGFPSADLSFAAYPDGSTANGAMPTKEQAEFVKRWNAYPELVAALEAIREWSNSRDGAAETDEAALTEINDIAARAILATLQGIPA